MEAGKILLEAGCNDARGSPISETGGVRISRQLVCSAFLSRARLGDVVAFNCNMGHAAFVSHQWLAKDHLDTDFNQMQVL